MHQFATQKLHSTDIFSLKNKLFICVAYMLIAIIGSCTFGSAMISEAQSRFKSEFIELSIPDDFEVIENKQAIIALRDKTQGFPTFNVLLLPGSWPFKLEQLQKSGKRIADDYSLVGLRNVEIDEISQISISGQNGISAHLSYKIATVPYYSEVLIISGSDRHLILTSVYKGKTDEQSKKSINHLLSSIVINLPTLKQAEPLDNATSLNTKTPLILAILLPLVLIILLIYRKNKLSN